MVEDSIYYWGKHQFSEKDDKLKRQHEWIVKLIKMLVHGFEKHYSLNRAQISKDAIEKLTEEYPSVSACLLHWELDQVKEKTESIFFRKNDSLQIKYFLHTTWIKKSDFTWPQHHEKRYRHLLDYEEKITRAISKGIYAPDMILNPANMTQFLEILHLRSEMPKSKEYAKPVLYGFSKFKPFPYMLQKMYDAYNLQYKTLDKDDDWTFAKDLAEYIPFNIHSYYLQYQKELRNKNSTLLFKKKIDLSKPIEFGNKSINYSLDNEANNILKEYIPNTLKAIEKDMIIVAISYRDSGYKEDMHNNINSLRNGNEDNLSLMLEYLKSKNCYLVRFGKRYMNTANNFIDEDISKFGSNDLIYDKIQTSLSRVAEFCIGGSGGSSHIASTFSEKPSIYLNTIMSSFIGNLGSSVSINIPKVIEYIKLTTRRDGKVFLSESWHKLVEEGKLGIRCNNQQETLNAIKNILDTLIDNRMNTALQQKNLDKNVVNLYELSIYSKNRFLRESWSNNAVATLLSNKSQIIEYF
ncbi:hypothetical protein SynA1524_00096 [Synechococcus sp. A15-24]|nr:hypothetical protein SynA1524_00096 [Synechococcus sp. A15-24]